MLRHLAPGHGSNSTAPTAAYRLVKATNARSAHASDHVVARFDSAYEAMEAMQREFIKRAGQPPDWYLIDPAGVVLLTPDDLYDIAA